MSIASILFFLIFKFINCCKKLINRVLNHAKEILVRAILNGDDTA